jgi:hypothetical protein
MSRAEWPVARITAEPWISSPAAVHTPRIRPPEIRKSVTLVSKRTSPPAVEDRCPHRLDHVGQQVGADVRVGVGEDPARVRHGRRGFHKSGRPARAWWRGCRACRRRRCRRRPRRSNSSSPRSPALAQQRGEIETPGAGVLAALEHDRLEAVFQAAQGGEHAGRAAADDAVSSSDFPAAGRCQRFRSVPGRGIPASCGGSRSGFHARLQSRMRIGVCLPASSTLTKVTLVEKIGLPGRRFRRSR